MLDFSRAERVAAATGGAATSVWRIEQAGRRYALRVFQAHERHVLERELLAMSAAARGGVPVPRVYARGTYDQRPALVLEWCRGSTLPDVFQRQPRLTLSLGHASGRVHAAMHRVRAPAGLRTNWIDWPAAAEPVLAARLGPLSLGAHRLVHMDFHPLNVLADGGQITAVLDWTNAHGGDPRADVARTVTILRVMPHVLRLATSARLGFVLFELAWRSGYGSFGRDMAPFYAWAGGAMLADLAARHTSADLEPVRRWTRAWRRRAGLPSR